MTVYHEFDLLPVGHAGRPRAGFCFTEHAMIWPERIRRHRDEILRLAARHGVKNVRIFGSVARGEADEQSDVDLLVDMEPDRSLLDLGGFQVEVQELLGCKVDVLTEGGIYWLLKRRILKEARPL